MRKKRGGKTRRCGSEGWQRAWICKENKRCCFCWLGFDCCNLYFSHVGATKCFRCFRFKKKNKNKKQMKLTVDWRLAQRWTFLLWQWRGWANCWFGVFFFFLESPSPDSPGPRKPVLDPTHPPWPEHKPRRLTWTSSSREPVTGGRTSALSPSVRFWKTTFSTNCTR